MKSVTNKSDRDVFINGKRVAPGSTVIDDRLFGLMRENDLAKVKEWTGCDSDMHSVGRRDSASMPRVIAGGIDDMDLLEMRNNFVEGMRRAETALRGKVVVNPDYDPCEFRFKSYQPDEMEAYL